MGEGTLRGQMEQRLATLQQELSIGQGRVAQLEQQLAQLRETVVRIGGAVMVLEELLAGAADAGDEGESAGDAGARPGEALVADGTGGAGLRR